MQARLDIKILGTFTGALYVFACGQHRRPPASITSEAVVAGPQCKVVLISHIASSDRDQEKDSESRPHRGRAESHHLWTPLLRCILTATPSYGDLPHKVEKE